MPRHDAPPRKRIFPKLIALMLVVAAVALALLLYQSPQARRFLGIPKVHPGYEWLHGGLEEGRRVAEAALDTSAARANFLRARALEEAIRYSEANARRLGTQPIPEDVRRSLEPHFPEELLERVEWTLAEKGLDLGSLVAAWYGREGGAVTLDDTIVYSDRRTARNLLLWAHELTHALQYEQLGIRDFARLYAVNHQLLERQAWANARRVAAAVREDRARAQAARNTGPARREDALPEARPLFGRS